MILPCSKDNETIRPAEPKEEPDMPIKLVRVGKKK
jgi:hypothetical protein